MAFSPHSKSLLSVTPWFYMEVSTFVLFGWNCCGPQVRRVFLAQ